MRVEEARQKAPARDDKEEASASERLHPKVPRRKKAKAKEDGVIPGHELEDRKVKRGWTEPTRNASKQLKTWKDKSGKRMKSKPKSITGEAECLFKAEIPPNATTPGSSQKADGRVKKRKRGESSRDTILHEFANTVKHANFLRSASGTDNAKRTSAYVEGKGWVDEDGNIVEKEPLKRREKAIQEDKSKGEAEKLRNTRSTRSSKQDVPSVQVTSPPTEDAHEAPTDETSSSGTSSSSENECEGETSAASLTPRPTKSSKKGNEKQEPIQHQLGKPKHDVIEVDQVERLSITRSSPTPPIDIVEEPTSAPSQTEVHPLEALFKRPNTAASHTPKKPALEVTTNFNFSDPDVGEASQGLLIPQTPFTQQDIRQRRQRSAAPTPDTAAPWKTFGDVLTGASDDGSDVDNNEVGEIPRSVNNATEKSTEEKPESEFSKWFWEHRGENNRAWKRRRREAAREKRQKENRERRG